MNFEFAREAQIALKTMSGRQIFRMRVLGSKIYLAHEKRGGWTGQLPFYLFWCRVCSHYSKDYPHSWPESQYLLCSYCGVKHDFVSFLAKIDRLATLLKLRWKYRELRRL